MPATISVTRSAAAAMRWFTAPSRSRKRSPISVGGCTPSPTSLETTTSETPPLAQDGGELVGRLPGWPRRRRPRSRRLATQTVRQSTTIRSSCGARRRQAPTRSSGSSTVSQSAGPLRPMPRDAVPPCRRRAARAVATKADAGRTRRGQGDGVAALAAARAAENEMRLCSDVPRVLPRRPVWVTAPGQVSWLSDRPTPRAFPARLRPVADRGFRPRLQ